MKLSELKESQGGDGFKQGPNYPVDPEWTRGKIIDLADDDAVWHPIVLIAYLLKATNTNQIMALDSDDEDTDEEKFEELTDGFDAGDHLDGPEFGYQAITVGTYQGKPAVMIGEHGLTIIGYKK